MAEDTQQGRYLLFAVGQETYGIPISAVTEIIGMQPISRLPDMPDCVKGVINLRGRVIPVVDMRLRIKEKAKSYTDRTCIIVIETQRIAAGLIVDQVLEVAMVKDVDISPPPAMQLRGSLCYISGIAKTDGKIKLLIDCERLFNDKETTVLDNMNKGEVKT